jgi:hypothetical protein
MVVNKGISVTYKSNTTSATCGAGIAYPSRTHEFTPVFGGVRDARSLVFYVALCRSLCVLLSFFIWPCYCMSSCPFSFGHGIVCPFVLFHLAMVLCVLLSFFIWPWYCVSFCPFSCGHGIVCPLVLFHLAMVLCVLRFTASVYHFGIFKLTYVKTMFGSCLPLVVCRRAHVLFTLFVLVCVQWCPTHIMLCFCFVFLRLVTYVASLSGLSICDSPFGIH